MIITINLSRLQYQDAGASSNKAWAEFLDEHRDTIIFEVEAGDDGSQISMAVSVIEELTKKRIL